ncbi:MAG: type II toxin-antitoxin system HicA family toxin [Patescibacteria group bacterium]
MPKLVPISAKKMLKILKKKGFLILRQKGSHVFLEHPINKCTTVIPLHRNENLGIGLLRSVLNDIEMSVEEYDKLRKKS